MSADDIPEECLKDPQFMNNFIATMCSSITKQEKILTEQTAALNKSKEEIAKGLEHRKMLKKMFEAEKVKKQLLEPTLANLKLRVAVQQTKLALVKAQLDDESLREKADIEKFKDAVQLYTSTWEKREAEYEATIPLTSPREKANVELRALEIEAMVLAQQKEDLIKRQEQKRQIDERRFQVELVELLETMSKRSKLEEKLKSMDIRNEEHSKELKALKKQKERLLKKKEEEEREKLRARQLMPPPKLDMSMLKTFCPTSTSEHHIQRSSESHRMASFDSDNISINTEVLEEMCIQDQLMDVTEDDENEEIPDPYPLARSITMVCTQALQSQKNNELPENIEVLEKSYSQLSLEKENNDSASDDSPINSPIEVQVIVEPPKPKDSPVPKPSSILKAQGILRKPKTTMEKPEGPPEQKKPRIDDKKEKKSPVKPIKDQRDEPRELPKIKSIETITRPVAVVTKPLVAEVTPTLSTLFCERTYAPSSCASSDDLDTDIDDTPDPPNQTSNWGNFSPLRCTESETSFSSNISAFKQISADDAQQKQTTNTAFPESTQFFSMFQGPTGGYF